MAKFFICGDIANKYSSEQFISDELIEIIKNSDYSICNFEGAIPSENRDNGVSVFQKPTTLGNLKEAGFDMLLLANNHITDLGKEGLENTINQADKLSFDYIGAGFALEEVYKAKIVEIDSLKFGLINICEAQVGQFVDEGQDYGYAWMGHHYVEELIKKTKRKVDYLLLFVHAGLEYFDMPIVEYRKLYRRYCDLGVDCVIGGHTHIAQGVEKYNEKYIFYSLGNFLLPYPAEESYKSKANHSYSIILDFSKENIEYTPVFHYLDNLKVNLTSSTQSLVNLESLNENLEEPRYSKLIENVYEDANQRLTKNLYRQALMGTDSNDSFIASIKHIIKYAFFRKKYWKDTELYRNKLLLRLLQNETYQFLAQHILTKKIKNEK